LNTLVGQTFQSGTVQVKVDTEGCDRMGRLGT
jgi:hypothetical protein